MLKIDTFKGNLWNEECDLMSSKVRWRLQGLVSVAKVSMQLLGDSVRSLSRMEVRESGLRARRAMARFPSVERMRAIPVPVLGPAPRIMARPEGGIVVWVVRELISFDGFMRMLLTLNWNVVRHCWWW